MAGKIERVGDLEVGQDLQFQEREWRVEFVGWMIMALILIAALLGLLGPGLFSSQTAGERGSALWVEHNRFTRYQSPDTLKVHLRPTNEPGGQTRLWLNRSFVDGVQMEDIEPEPERVEVGSDRFVYTFNLPEPGQATMITFHFEPNAFGSMPVNVGVEGGPELNFNQFYFP